MLSKTIPFARTLTQTLLRRPSLALTVQSAALALGLAMHQPCFANERSEAALLSFSAVVKSVDVAKREITLEGPMGNVSTLAVGPQVQRLEEVKPGNKVYVDYYVSLASEVREATPEEKAAGVSVIKEAARSPAEKMPAAGAVRITKAVTTVEGIDRPTHSLTIKGPQGTLYMVVVKDDVPLEQFKLGDTIVVTFTEALAVSLTKR